MLRTSRIRTSQQSNGVPFLDYCCCSLGKFTLGGPVNNYHVSYYCERMDWIRVDDARMLKEILPKPVKLKMTAIKKNIIHDHLNST